MRWKFSGFPQVIDLLDGCDLLTSYLDAKHGNRAGLLSVVMTIHKLAAFSELVKPGVEAIVHCHTTVE